MHRLRYGIDSSPVKQAILSALTAVIAGLIAAILFSIAALLENGESAITSIGALAVSIVPLATWIGYRGIAHQFLFAALAFIVFQAAPAVIWPTIFGDAMSILWGINLHNIEMQAFAPLLALLFWLIGTLSGRSLSKGKQRSNRG
jgi:hypothetical protein